MTNEIPDIDVKREVKKINNTNPNIRDVICLIGGFEAKIDSEHGTVQDEPVFFETYSEAKAALEDGSESTLPDANKALKLLFTDDISGILCVNISTFTGSGTPTWSRTVTKTKLETALASVNQMEFDQLFVAAELTDELITVIDTEAKARFEDKKPLSWAGVGTRANASAYTTTASKLGDYCAAFLTQPLEVKNTLLSLIESGAWLSNYIARLPVGNSLTAKELTDVTGLGTSYTFADGDIGKTLVGLGFFVVRLLSPKNKTYECVNSAGANGLDLYITRSTVYIINDFSLRKFLGDKNNTPTLDNLKMECNRLLTKFRDDLKIVENINYAVERVDSKTAKVILNSIQYSDVLTKLKVYVTIEVV